MPNLYKLPFLIICFITFYSCTPEVLEEKETTIHLENPEIYLEEGTEEEVPLDDKKN